MSRTPSVLVVDDDRLMRELLRTSFERAGFAVCTFASAADLLERADLQAPGVLVLDVQMPGMSGPELQLLLRRRGIKLPIIFLTGSADIPIAVAAMRNGAIDFIEKPFDGATLVEGVRRALARHVRPSTPVADNRWGLLVTSLTPRELQVLDAIVTGRTSKQIARDLGGSFRTIETHRSRVMAKMGTASLAELVRQSIEASNAR